MINTQLEKCSHLAEVELRYKNKIKVSEMDTITSSKDAECVLRKVFDNDTLEHVETFVLLLLNRSNKVLGWAKISVGGVSGTIVDCKVIFQLAFNANASGIILSHNHPSGALLASYEDKLLTQKVKDACRVMDIQLVDHIIITAENYSSMADDGLL